MKTKTIENETASAIDDFFDRFMASPQKMTAKAFFYSDGLAYPFHKHTPIQFMYASEGVMKVTTEQGVWVVPNHRAVWVPSDTLHKTEASNSLAMRNLYFKPDCFPQFPNECCVVSVPPLLRELIQYATEMSAEYQENSPESRIMNVILDQLSFLDTSPLFLPTPSDSRLLSITNCLAKHPGDNRSLQVWGKKVGATERTLARLFKKETGMSFRQWRQQARLIESLHLLAKGTSVNEAAFEMGYESVSAFIYMFRKSTGCTPGQFFASN